MKHHQWLSLLFGMLLALPLMAGPVVFPQEPPGRTPCQPLGGGAFADGKTAPGCYQIRIVTKRKEPGKCDSGSPRCKFTNVEAELVGCDEDWNGRGRPRFALLGYDDEVAIPADGDVVIRYRHDPILPDCGGEELTLTPTLFDEERQELSPPLVATFACTPCIDAE